MSPAGGWGGAPRQEVIIDFWARLNKTKSEKVVELSDTTTVHYYKDGVNGNEVWHYKIKRFGHSVPSKTKTGINASEEVWKFFSQY